MADIKRCDNCNEVYDPAPMFQQMQDVKTTYQIKKVSSVSWGGDDGTFDICSAACLRDFGDKHSLTPGKGRTPTEGIDDIVHRDLRWCHAVLQGIPERLYDADPDDTTDVDFVRDVIAKLGDIINETSEGASDA